MCKRPECGSAVGAHGNMSSLLLDLPSIIGAFIISHTIGDVILGEAVEPDVVVSASPSVGGLLDSLAGSIGISGISSSAKPVTTSATTSSASGNAVRGAVMCHTPKIGSKKPNK